MDDLFSSARNELETSNLVLTLTMEEAFELCRRRQFDSASDTVAVFASLLDRLSLRIVHVLHAIKQHGTRFGTLPNVEPLSPLNFRGATPQRISRTDSLIAKIVMGQRSRFFHKLSALEEIVRTLQSESRRLVDRSSMAFSNDILPQNVELNSKRQQRGSFSGRVSASQTPWGFSSFFQGISESPRLKFATAWGSFGVLVVPLAAMVAAGMSERTAFLTLFASLLPVQYCLFAVARISKRTPPQEVKYGRTPRSDWVPLKGGVQSEMDKIEILGYDLSTCLGETTILLKSFFCALPEDQLATFRSKLLADLPNFGIDQSREPHLSGREGKARYLTVEEIIARKGAVA